MSNNNHPLTHHYSEDEFYKKYRPIGFENIPIIGPFFYLGRIWSLVLDIVNTSNVVSVVLVVLLICLFAFLVFLFLLTPWFSYALVNMVSRNKKWITPDHEDKNGNGPTTGN